MINQVTLPDSKPVWDRVYAANPLQAPFLIWAWHNDWTRILAGEWTSYCLIIDDDVIAPLAKNGDTVIFSGGDEIADYLDLIGPEEKKFGAWEQIIPFLKKQGVKNIRLRNVPQHSPTLSFFQKLKGAVAEQEDTTPIITLPASWEAYVGSLPKKYRHELERKIRKFDREHPDAELIKSVDPEGDLRLLFELMEKDKSKRAFLTPDMKTFFTAITQSFKNHISLLYIRSGDKNMAATFSFVFEDTYYLYNSGFDKECCANAGYYLKAASLKRAIEKGIKHYNFLQGNERYKYELGGVDFPVYRITHQLSESTVS
ncbi:hypothetical protein A3A63_01410 [Candidatus Gottesmanbacteria bacterium RIFCSPLOWO2_01_FULL_46_9]|uniref:BioF2-like acetyltransferase domain-containing protein n=1 Tax=Candidatus Gottesmanbacteria bacterium RIFCSPLOWO2_01_FULL_46_9 TaxID=1798394 RepID=A0A1F6B100_9BACT|nr:MAG: hypothetical protein A3A63_01410 [Candidatus Gottesmanbacteria bacterium RIFCSPLOWO2_01_FULL_46_9]